MILIALCSILLHSPSLCVSSFFPLSPHPPYSLSSVGYVWNRLSFQKISLTKCLWKWFDSAGILTKLYELLTIHYSSFKVLQKRNFNSLNLHLTPTDDHTLDFVISSVAQSCLTLCDPMDCSTPDFPVHHQLPEIAQTHVHRVGDFVIVWGYFHSCKVWNSHLWP